MAVHWKAPLQAKGFLKIIEIIVAILCFSLVAGFSVTADLACNDAGEEPGQTANFTTKFPLQTYTEVNTNGSTTSDLPLGAGISQSAQLFVAWGSLSLIYGVVAIVVYMLFTANEQMQSIVDILVYADLGFNLCWVLCWFVASIDWAVGYNQLKSFFASQGEGLIKECLDPTLATVSQNYTQAAIAAVFGFLSLFLWGVNIFWVVIDTKLYIQWKANRNPDAPLMS